MYKNLPSYMCKICAVYIMQYDILIQFRSINEQKESLPSSEPHISLWIENIQKRSPLGLPGNVTSPPCPGKGDSTHACRSIAGSPDFFFTRILLPL